MLYTAFKTYSKIRTILELIDKIKDLKDCDNQLDRLFDRLEIEIFDGGCIYIKFTQWYISNLRANSTNNKVIEKFIKRFDNIFNNCGKHEFKYTQKLFQEEFNITLDAYAKNLELIASGSIGQVYKGRRRCDGQMIVIKVKHPEINEQIEQFEDVCNLIKMAQKIALLRQWFGLNFQFDDFVEDLKLQSNFTNEVNNTNKFRSIYNKNPNVYFPEIYDYSENIIISEYVDIIVPDTLTEYSKYKLVLNLICYIYDMIIVQNFIHSDLHAKNWGAMKVKNPDGIDSYKLVDIDCALCISSKNIEHNIQLMEAFEHNDLNFTISVMRNFIEVYPENEEYVKKKIENNIEQNGITAQLFLEVMNEIIEKQNTIIDIFPINLLLVLVLSEEFLKKTNITNCNSNNGNNNFIGHLKKIYLDMYTLCNNTNSYTGLADYLHNKLNNQDNEYKKKNELFGNFCKEIKFAPIEDDD